MDEKLQGWEEALVNLKHFNENENHEKAKKPKDMPKDSLKFLNECKVSVYVSIIEIECIH